MDWIDLAVILAALAVGGILTLPALARAPLWRAALAADLLGDREARLTVRGHYVARLLDLIEGARIAARMGR